MEQARAHCPDLIILDLQLPDHPGNWVLSELRRDPRTASMPVLSADATAARRDELHHAGAAGFLTKPFLVDDFARVTNTILRRRAA